MKNILLTFFFMLPIFIFSQAKSIEFLDRFDFSGSDGINYQVFCVADKFDNDMKTNATIRILYTINNQEKLVEYFANGSVETLADGNFKIFLIPNNNSFKSIKGEANYYPDSFIYIVNSTGGFISGEQSDGQGNKTTLIYKPMVTPSDMDTEMKKFYSKQDAAYYDLIMVIQSEKMKK